MRRKLGTCSACCRRPATHVARHGVYRDLPLCAHCHEGSRPDEGAHFYERIKDQRGR